MNDFNNDNFNTSGEDSVEPENYNYTPEPEKDTVTLESDNSTVASETESVETSTPQYFNNLHKEPEEDTSYHYSYVSQEEPKKDSQSEYSYSWKQEEKPAKKAKRKGRFGRFAKVVASALVFGLVAGAAFQGFNYVYYKANPSANPANTAIPATTTLTTSGDTISTTTDLSQMVENVMPSIVSITSIVEQQVSYGFWGQGGTQETEGAGSGIIIGQNDSELLVVTNYHVIEDAKSLTVSFIDEKTAAATVKGYDSDADIAVVSVSLKDMEDSTKSSIKVATLGKSSELKVGEPAIAIGNALGYGQSVTAGYVSALDREVALTDKTMTLLQTDAAINPGNSGGALLNIKGEVIGINTVKYSDTTVEGMGYAIPIDTASPIIESLMNKETVPEDQQAYLGIAGSDVTESYAQQLGLPAGIYVQEVQEGSPAELGGIYAGDVIIKYEGNTVSTMESLINKLGNSKAGDQVKITVSRRTQHGEFEDIDLTITLGAKSDQK